MSESRESLVDLTGQIVRHGEFPVAYGGFGDIWKCTWQRPTSDPVEVAVKVIRTHTSGDDDRNKKTKRLRREIRVWQRLNHKNIVPLYGVTSEFGPFVSMVCPWLENGSLDHYLKSCHAHLTLKDRFQLLDDVATGLQYLHSCSVIHGDLSSSNVLVDRNRNACLADFGLSIVILEFHGTSYYTSSLKGALRWTAPEIFNVPDGEDAAPCHPTEKSDIYSFGSVMLQAISGSAPYSNLKNDAQVLRAIFSGVTPTRPRNPEIDDRHWTFIQQCWSESGISRPSAEEAIKFCKGELYSSQLSVLNSGADAENKPIEPPWEGNHFRDNEYVSPPQERGEPPAVPDRVETPTIPDQISEVGAVVESPMMPATMRKSPILNPDVLEVKTPRAPPSDHNPTPICVFLSSKPVDGIPRGSGQGRSRGAAMDMAASEVLRAMDTRSPRSGLITPMTVFRVSLAPPNPPTISLPGMLAILARHPVWGIFTGTRLQQLSSGRTTERSSSGNLFS
ncbi:kinase-like protein [Leucogyrophana mollusca]|uniref:Kinase-like protein n=1 Tax=Leucogyrophana mollusca TaxID=85980 RepID=A0ACB8BAN2_9AGAM|nr:kinase-like protein [Leucogyrophana mollusca]